MKLKMLFHRIASPTAQAVTGLNTKTPLLLKVALALLCALPLKVSAIWDPILTPNEVDLSVSLQLVSAPAQFPLNNEWLNGLQFEVQYHTDQLSDLDPSSQTGIYVGQSPTLRWRFTYPNGEIGGEGTIVVQYGPSSLLKKGCFGKTPKPSRRFWLSRSFPHALT